ncbi:NigD-like protein [Bacteroides sp.]|uniref:NigD-like protein n=1 Tax=Bacteroides sp. TaxID=29523 RepID=UPI003AB29FDD
MKKQKMTFVALMILFLTMPMLQSCLDDWDDKYDTLFAIGTVKVIEGKDYYFALDEGSKLYPGDTTYVRDYALVDGQRAFVYFSELKEQVTGYDYNAQIKHIENILTKDIYFMPAEKNDSIGDDRVNATDFWITGDYLNIKYQFYYGSDKDKKHMLNLVVNEASTGEGHKADYVNLEFRHNAFNDSQLNLGTGLVSFKLDNIADLLAGKKGLNIRVKSLYDGERFATVDIEKK